MQPHTKFGIPDSNNIEDLLGEQLFYTLGQRSSLQRPQNGTLHSAIQRCTHTQIWNSYYKKYRKYASSQGHNDPNMKRDTPLSQDGFTDRIWDSYIG